MNDLRESDGTRRGSGALFPQTSWTLLADARATDAAGEAARREVVGRYYRPIRAYLMAIVRDGEQADEVTQAFFERIVLSGRLVRAADREKGSFRPFLKQALRYFVIDHRRRHGPPVVRPDHSTQGWDVLLDGKEPPSAEVEYHRAWVRALLEQALEQVRTACADKGQIEHFELFSARYLAATEPVPSWGELGRPYGLDEKAARNRTETVARRFRLVLRRLVAQETGSVEAANREIAALLEPL
jgi:DNA-directed RNA polymerase specialized sigma24 family protein